MNRPEQALQQATVEWLRLAAPDLMFFHVPNAINAGGKLAVRAGAINKSLGVLAGVPDLVFIFEDGETAFIELKAGKAKQTPAQEEFQKEVEGRGLSYVVCRSIDDVQTTLESWGVPLRVSNPTTIVGRT